jgi:hypothetical protein
MEIKLPNKNKKNIIILSILAFVFLASGIFLLWRVNQPETVAPEEGEAACDCPEGYTYFAMGEGDKLYCVDNSWKETMPGACYKPVTNCTPPGYSGGRGWVSADCISPPVTKYTLKYIAGTGGTISGSTTQTVEKGKSGSEVTAVPNSGYRFSKWSDGKTSASRTDTNVQGDITVTAEFVAQTHYYTLKYIAGTGGRILGHVVQDVEKGKSGSEVTAVPNSGYRFSKWSDGKTSARRVDTNIQHDITVTAEFIVQTYAVTYDANGGSCNPSVRTVKYNGVSEAPTCTRAGYYIASFSRTKGSGGNLNTETGVVTNVSGNQTIQVNWSKSCGDGVCTEDENAQNCPADCDAVCGDSYCTHDENALTCPDDCPANCGDGFCTHDETNETCSADCPVDCGDDYCDPETETAANCPADCGAVCGDGFCTHDETSVNCPEDCGPVSSGEVPSTGIFDNTKTAMISGFLLIFLGFTWRILGKGIFVSIEFLGKVPKKISIQMRDIKEDIRAKKRIKEMKIADKRKKNFERKVVKD